MLIPVPSVSIIVVNGPTATALIVSIFAAKFASYLGLASILVSKAPPIWLVVLPTPASTECVSPTPLRIISIVPVTNAAPATNVTCVS